MMTKIEEFIHKYGCFVYTQGFNEGIEDKTGKKMLDNIDRIEKEMKKDLGKLIRELLK